MPQRDNDLAKYRKTLYHKILADRIEQLRTDVDKVKLSEEQGGFEAALKRLALARLPMSASLMKGGTRTMNTSIKNNNGKGVLSEEIQVDDDGEKFYVLIVEFGIRGCPKYRYKLADLEQYL